MPFNVKKNNICVLFLNFKSSYCVWSVLIKGRFHINRPTPFITIAFHRMRDTHCLTFNQKIATKTLNITVLSRLFGAFVLCFIANRTILNCLRHTSHNQNMDFRSHQKWSHNVHSHSSESCERQKGINKQRCQQLSPHRMRLQKVFISCGHSQIRSSNKLPKRRIIHLVGEVQPKSVRIHSVLQIY